jgi:hypothetical protein
MFKYIVLIDHIYILYKTCKELSYNKEEIINKWITFTSIQWIFYIIDIVYENINYYLELNYLSYITYIICNYLKLTIYMYNIFSKDTENKIISITYNIYNNNHIIINKIYEKCDLWLNKPLNKIHTVIRLSYEKNTYSVVIPRMLNHVSTYLKNKILKKK